MQIFENINATVSINSIKNNYVIVYNLDMQLTILCDLVANTFWH
jgi:hypothetical protein